METTYKYIGQRLTVRIVPYEFDKSQWEPRISITGSVHPLTFNTNYPRRGFDTENEAMEYGKAAAQWIVDHPTRAAEPKKKRSPRKT